MSLGTHSGHSLAAALLVILLFCSGCMSVPGPAPASAPATTTSSPKEILTMRTSTIMATPSPTSAVLVTAPPVAVTRQTPSLQKTASELRTCSQQGGSIAPYGYQCPGAWLSASDTFSCCPVPPVRETSRNMSMTVTPFDVIIVMDDDPGSITP